MYSVDNVNGNLCWNIVKKPIRLLFLYPLNAGNVAKMQQIEKVAAQVSGYGSPGGSRLAASSFAEHIG